MKAVKVIIWVLVLAILSWLGIWFYNNYTTNQNANLTSNAANSADQGNAPVSTSTATETGSAAVTATTDTNVTSDKPQVRTIQTATGSQITLNFLGTVKSLSQVEIYPQTAAELKQVFIAPGSLVQKGDVIAELGGTNGQPHQAEKQYQIALTNFNSAQKALQTTKKQVAVGKNSAELQLQSAQNQFQAISTDLAQIDNNYQNLQNSLRTLGSTWNTTQRKNQRDLSKAQSDIDTLIFQINALQDEKRRLVEQEQDLVDQQNYQSAGSATPTPESATPDSAAVPSNANGNDSLTALKTQQNALNETLEQLYSSLNSAQYGYSSALSGIDLGNNQLSSQTDQLQTQAENLQLSRQSTITKLGYNGETADSLELAKQSYQNTLLTLENSLNQVTTQASLSKTNLELAQIGLNNLKIFAPASGILGEINANPGDLVSPQTLFSNIIQNDRNELEIAVNLDTADRLVVGTPAKISFANREIDSRVVRISPLADSKTRLVAVYLALPNIPFRPNQTLDAQLILPNTQTSAQSDSPALFLPLDAVLIGTQESFVFVVEEGRAVKKNVVLGEINGDVVEVLSGLSVTDQVVVDGAKDLIEGQSVEVVE